MAENNNITDNSNLSQGARETTTAGTQSNLDYSDDLETNNDEMRTTKHPDYVVDDVAGEMSPPPIPTVKSNNSQNTSDIISLTSSGGQSNETTLSQRLMRAEEETFYSAEENKHGDDNIWGLLSGVAGNIYEWYDFAIYGLLSSEIGASFFPKASKELQIINSFGVFFAAFLMRPIGAIIFGEIGDRLFGRKNALIMSIVMITVPSVLMGLLPSYDMIGPAAPIILIVLRMIQGLSVGGQLAGSYVLSIEQSTVSNRGFRGSICDASSVGGFVLASLVTTIVRATLDDDTMNEWGWRVPFLLSLLLAPVLYQIVKRSEESKLWSERAEQKETQEIIREVENKESTPAVVDLLSTRFRRRQLTGAILVLSVKAASFYMLFVWTPIYMSELRGLVSDQQADLLNLITVTSYIFFLVIGGKLSDHFPHRTDLIKIGVCGCIIAAPVMFGMFESESFIGYLLGQLQYALCLSWIQGGIAAFEVELWMNDPSLSFTGVAMGHNLAATIFGGTMPLAASALYFYGNSLCGSDDDLYCRLVPGFYISVLGFVSLFSVGYLIRHPHDVRTGDKKLMSAKSMKKLQSRIEKERKKRAIAEVGAGGYWASPASTFGMESLRGDEPKSNSYVPPLT